MKRYESRACTYSVPDDWVPEPPFGFAGPGDEDSSISVQVLERWLDRPITAAAYAARDKEALAAVFPGFALLSEGEARPTGPSEGWQLEFRRDNDDGKPVLERHLYLLLGPLLCELQMVGPVSGPSPTERVFGSIGQTLALTGVDFLQKVSQEGLGLAAAIGATPRAGEPRRSFPRMCISLPVPAGWDMTEEDGAAVLRRSSTTIELRRPLDSDGDVSTWFRDTMSRLQDEGSALLGWEQGELPGNRRFAAVHVDEKGTARTWSSAAVRQRLAVFVADQQPVEWLLRVEPAGLCAARSALCGLVAGAAMLPSPEWQTKLAEPWIDLTLAGPWQAQGAGVYVRAEGNLAFILLSEHRGKLDLAKLQPALTNSLRQPFFSVSREEAAQGLLRGLEAFHYNVDGEAGEEGADGTVGVRGLWVAGEKVSHSVMIRCTHLPDADDLLTRVVNALRIPGMRG